MGVDERTFAINMALIIGGAVALGLLTMLIFITWTGIKVVIWIFQRRAAERAWRKATRRADGTLYPPTIEGICGECGRGGRKIYFPPDSNKALCPPCYEVNWRRCDGAVAEVAAT